MIVLEAKGIKKNFGGVKALKNGSIKLEKGTVCGLLGANGSGKTTLAKILSGLIPIDDGEIFLNGKKVTIHSSNDSKKLGISMVHQNFSLVDEMTVWQNINLGHEKKRWGFWLNNKDSIESAQKTLDLLNPDIDIFENVGSLSPTDKQLVEIVKAVSVNPKILILDEPTSSLRFSEVEKLFKLVEEMKSNGVSIIFISHRISEVMRICDYITVLRDGNTVGDIKLKDLDADKRNDSIMSLITDKKAGKKYSNRRSYTTKEVMLEARDLTVKDTLKNIDLKIHKGEIVGISGLQNQGQEELMLALSGFTKLDKGQILLKGKKKSWKSTKEAIMDGVVLVPGDRQKEGIFIEHNILDNLLYPDYCKRNSSFIFNEKKSGTKVKKIIEDISLMPRDYNVEAKNLSGGNQQKIVLGKWFNQSPDVLLLCDPSKGIDIETKRELLEMYKLLVAAGRSIVFFSSENEELVQVADRVLVMFEGSIIDEIPREKINNNVLIASSLGIKKNAK